MATIKTTAVRNAVLGEARKILKDVAGSNGVVSRAEAGRLPVDIAQAVETARASGPRVSVDAAMDAYARKVARVLTAVDTRSKGTLSAAEANKISEPALRARVLDVRANLLRGDAGPGSSVATPVFERLKTLSTGMVYSSGGAVEANLKPFMSSTAVTGDLTAEKVRDLLAPKWDRLTQAIWSDGTALNNSQPGLGDLAALELYKSSDAETAQELDYLSGPDGGTGFRSLVRHMRAELTDIVQVTFMERDSSGRPMDLGHLGKFIGGKTSDNRVVGFFTGMFVE